MKLMIRAFLLLILCLSPYSVAFAAIAVDNTSTVDANRPSSLTVSHATSGANRLMLVGVSINNDGNETVSSVTYGGNSLTSLGFQNNGNGSRVEIWSLVAPATGTANVVVTFNNQVDQRAGMGVVTFTGVDQATPTSGFTSDAGESSTASVTIPSAADELAFSVVTSIEQTQRPPNAGTGVTALWRYRNGSSVVGAGGTKAGAASVNMSWSLRNSKKWAIAGLSIKPSAAVSTATLVGNYYFDEEGWNGTSGEVTDNTGGTNGTASGGADTVAAGKICRAGSFDGVDDYVEVTNLSDLLNDSASLVFWIKTTQTGNDTSWQAPGVAGVEVAGGTDDIFWGWLDATGHIGLGTGNLYGAKSVTAINDGNWHHIVLTRNASDGAYTVFVDGVLERSGTLASGVIGAGYSSFGRIEDSAGTPIYFSGDLDEVYIFDGVIDSAKVNELLNDSRSCLQCVNDDFNGATLGSDWAVSSSGGTFGNPRIVNGRLRLTDSSNSVATAASLLRLFPGAGNEIIYEFDHYAYSGSGADGIAITLSDASITPIPGGYGGSLGYAQRCGIDGFAGGWLGVGIDEYGNFRNDGECRGDGGSPTGRVLDSVSIRGSGSAQVGYLLHAESGSLSPQIDDSGSSTAAYGHRYRIIVNHTDNIHSYVTIERDTGSGFQTLIPTYDATAQAGQAAVPTNWLISMTGSTGGSTNIHEIDNLEVCATSILPYTGIDHYRFVHDGAALSCAPEDIQVRACLDTACSVEYSGAIDATFSPSGWVGGDSQSFLSSDTLQLWHTTPESVTLDVSGNSAEFVALNPPRCFIGATEQADCSMEFFDSGFVFNVPDLTSCQPSPAVSIQAVRTDATTQTCTANSDFANTNTMVNFWSSYSNPVSGTEQIDLSGTSIATSSPGTGILLSFDAAATANFTVTYPDAGQMLLNARFDGTVGAADEGLVLFGNDSFVARPVGLCVESNDANADCTTGASCSVFRKVDQDFNLNVRAVCWESAGDTDFCSGNQTTPNYEQSGIPITHNLVAPVGGSLGAIGVGSVDMVDADSGNHVITNQNVSEVGAFTFEAAPPDYFGESLPAATSNNIGRFIPDHFTVAANTPIFSEGCMAGAADFTYLGQDFGYLIDPVWTVTAVNAANVPTNNYGNAFWNLNSTLLNRNHADATGLASISVQNTGNVSLSEETDYDGDGELTLSGARLAYTKPATVLAPFDTSIDLIVPAGNLQDSDGVCFDAEPDGVCDPFTVSAIGDTEQRYGQLVLQNAYGPETLPLTLTLSAEYFNGSSFIVNVDDSCTNYNFSELALSSYQGNLNDPETTPLGSGTLVAGVGMGMSLSAPGDGNDGSVDLTLDLSQVTGLNLPWLQSAGADPTGKATFGIFKGNERLIYMRESVQ